MEYKHIDLQEDRKLAILVNVGALIIFAILLTIGIIIVPISEIFTSSLETIQDVLVKMFITIVLLFGYIFMHEAVHGVFMKHYGKVKPKFGFTKLYAYAGSDAYFNKKEYMIISFSPVVILGIVLFFLLILTPNDWFWVIYYIFATNIAGSAGDLYVACKSTQMPKESLFLDAGVSMTIYTKK